MSRARAKRHRSKSHAKTRRGGGWLGVSIGMEGAALLWTHPALLPGCEQ